MKKKTKIKIFAFLAVSIWIFVEMDGKCLGDFLGSMCVTLFVYFLYKVAVASLFGTKCSSKVSFSGKNRFMNHVEKDVEQSIWNFVGSRDGYGYSGGSSYDSKKAANQRVFNQTKARNEAQFHQYYANKNAGTYDGYQSANRAQSARNRANRY